MTCFKSPYCGIIYHSAIANQIKCLQIFLTWEVFILLLLLKYIFAKKCVGIYFLSTHRKYYFGITLAVEKSAVSLCQSFEDDLLFVLFCFIHIFVVLNLWQFVNIHSLPVVFQNFIKVSNWVFFLSFFV